MLLMTKIIFENVISIDVAKGIALLLRLILKGNGLKVAQKSQAISFQFILSFLPILSTFCL